MIIGIHHVQITIPKDQENEARSFYCDVLQLQVISKPSSLAGRGGFWVQVGDRELHIGVEDGVDRTLTKAHIAYEVTDLHAVEQLLRDHGIHIYESVPIPGYNRFEFRDPFGNRVECIQRMNTK